MGGRVSTIPGIRIPTWIVSAEPVEREVDDAQRVPLLQESARIFSRDLPALPLYFRPTVAAARRGLTNYRPMQTSDPAANEMWNAHQWAWP